MARAGGNRGIGLAAAHALADDGADVIVTYRSHPGEADSAVAELSRIRDDDAYRSMVTANHAFGRVGEPADIGGAVRTLVSESAGWITAQRIEASGGQSI